MMGWTDILSQLGVTTADMGSKAAVDPWNNVTSTDATNKSLGTIQQSLGQSEAISASINKFSADQFNQMRNTIAPGSTQLTADSISALDKLVSGGLPDSILADISRSSAETSVAGGYGGSQFAATSAGTRVGLAALQNLSQTIGQAGDFMAKSQAGMPKQFDMSSLMINPSQQLQLDQFNAVQGQQTQQLANNIKAAPTPQAAYALQLGAPLIGQQIATQSYFQNMMSMQNWQQQQANKPILINGMPMGPGNNYWQGV